MSLLQVENLKVYFPVSRGGLFGRDKRFVRAVDGINFEIGESETLGLVGESGCGKSTTGRALMQLIQATEGKIRFDGTEFSTFNKDTLKIFRQKIQMIFQNPYSSLNPRMTVGSIIAEPLKSMTSLSKTQRLERVRQLMNDVNLNQKFINRYPHEFSGGQRQRINIARALAISPKLIIADEPVSALDVSIQAQIVNLLQDLQLKYKMAFLFVAHDLSVVKTLSHRVAVMYLGKIVEMGATSTLYDDPKHPYTQALISSVPIPDPVKESNRKRILATGEIPSPINPPAGCTFHPRCPVAKERCRLEAPQLRILPNGSAVSCHFAE